MRNQKNSTFGNLFATLDRFTTVWSDPTLAHDVAQHLGCTELDALANVLKAAGNEHAAAIWTACHAEQDEQDDTHYGQNTTLNPAECPHQVVDAQTFGIDYKSMCESHASDLIRSVSDGKGIVLQMFRTEDLYRHCQDTLKGIPAEYHPFVIQETKNRLGWVEDAFDEWERIGNIIQNVVAENRIPAE